MQPLVPILAVEVGTSVRTLATGRMSFHGEVDHGDMGGYRFSMTPRDSDAVDAAAVAFDLRALGGRTLYGGAELSVGGVSTASSLDMTLTIDDPAAQAAETSPELSLFVSSGVFAGVRTRLGPITLSGEAFGGVRLISAHVESRYGECVTTATATDVSPAAELRARADLWVSPWFSLGAFAGQDILQPEVRALGVYFGGHVRAFDGMR
jgi:hypothetical protein